MFAEAAGAAAAASPVAPHQNQQQKQKCEQTLSFWIFGKDKWPSIYPDESWCSLFVNAESWCFCLCMQRQWEPKNTHFSCSHTHKLTHSHPHRHWHSPPTPVNDEWVLGTDAVDTVTCSRFSFGCIYPIVFNKINNGSMWWTSAMSNASRFGSGNSNALVQLTTILF